MYKVLPVIIDSISNPKLRKSDMKKELNNVNSEISMRKFDKSLSVYLLFKGICPNGNLLFNDSLGD
jgi:secreted Zn-dependent insulinase-like peptidase